MKKKRGRLLIIAAVPAQAAEVREKATDFILSERKCELMEAFHSLWTKPSGRVIAEEFELLTIILSALKWREKNGRITLVTDTRGKEFFDEKGLLSCWNDVTTDLDNIPECIDPARFWAAGKIYALTGFKAPVVSVDTDFIVWEAMNLENSKSRVCAIHRETLNPELYPNTREFTDFDDSFSWEVLPANTAFVYFGDEAFKNEYVRYAHNYMSTCGGGDCLRPMVFAEQRLLAMVADKMGLRLDVFSSLEKLSRGEDDRFTHLWGFKKQLRENEELKEEYTRRLKNRIMKDFPEIYRDCCL